MGEMTLAKRRAVYQRSTLTIVRESETPKYCVGLPNYTASQSVGLLNF